MTSEIECAECNGRGAIYSYRCEQWLGCETCEGVGLQACAACGEHHIGRCPPPEQRRGLLNLAISAAILLVSAWALCCGCDGTYSVTPVTKLHQDEALRIVWVDTYGMQLADAPAVDWVEAPRLDCAGGEGWSLADGACVGGLTSPDLQPVQVAWVEYYTLSRSAFSHELCHRRMWLLTGDLDAGHQGECFLGDLTGAADEKLRAVGL